ncbi:MAG: hypothetical protein IJZ89_01215 [Clostridia bacterium]|nr:hypothetical protein [Clostridia bacterium]
MRILIAYSTKTGTCKECAKLLASELTRHDIDIVDLSKSDPEISNYDLSVIGGSIRMGKLDKRTLSFLTKNKDKLLNSNAAYFICNGFNEETDNYFKKCFPALLIERSLLHDTFGGELKLDKQKGLDKFIVKMLLKANEENDEFAMPSILTESIGRFADRIKEIGDLE